MPCVALTDRSTEGGHMPASHGPSLDEEGHARVGYWTRRHA